MATIVRDRQGRLLLHYTPTFPPLCGDILVDRSDNEFIVVQRKWSPEGCLDLVAEPYPQPSRMKVRKE